MRLDIGTMILFLLLIIPIIFPISLIFEDVLEQERSAYRVIVDFCEESSLSEWNVVGDSVNASITCHEYKEVESDGLRGLDFEHLQCKEEGGV